MTTIRTPKLPAFPFPKPASPPHRLGPSQFRKAPEKVTLSLADTFNGLGLSGALSSLKVKLVEALSNAPRATLTQGRDGMVRGPEGEPLVTVKRTDGSTVYVDPNTNRYYVANDKQGLISALTGQVTVTGPYALPESAEFSNSHFSDADVRELTRLARRPRGLDEFDVGGSRPVAL